jgi:tetratricopeptide (TPR) repeat protein
MRVFALALLFVPFLLGTGCDNKPADESVKEAPKEVPKEAPKQVIKSEAENAGVDKDGKPILGPGTDEQRTLLVKAKSALLTDDWENAEIHFKKLTETGELSGPQVTAYVALAQIYREGDTPEKAVELLSKLEGTELAEVQFVVARALADSGETTKAMRAYEKTIKIQPDYLQAVVELAGLYAKSGRKEESEKLFFKYEQQVYGYAKKLESMETPPEERLHALEVFTFVNDDRANQAIVAALNDPEPKIRAEAIDLVRDLKIGAAKEQVAEMVLNDPNLEVRMTAKEAMKTLPDAPTDGAKPTIKKN